MRHWKLDIRSWILEAVRFVRRYSPASSLQPPANQGFTLVETLVAITILVVAVAGPMSLATQSLATAFYARDQVIAFHLAQEAIEIIRASRDRNALRISQGETVDLLDGIPSVDGQPFVVDTITGEMSLCAISVCPVLRNNGEFYGYGIAEEWRDTRFTRIVRAVTVGMAGDEIRLSVEVRWKTGVYTSRSFTIYENLFRWVEPIEE